MNIQIRVQVPEDKSKSYSRDTDVQVITDPTTVRAVLATIMACEAAIAAVDDPRTEYPESITLEAMPGTTASDMD